MLVNLIKKYMIWMLLSYIVVSQLVHNFLIVPQNKTIAKCKDEKARVEYDYMMITATPEFINSLDNVIKEANKKTENFTWTDGQGIDAGLTFYNYIYTMAKKANLDLIQVSTVERRSGSKSSSKDKLYYTWKVLLTGGFPDVLSMIDSIERSQRFLVLEDITIIRDKDADEGARYDLTFLGIKKEAVDGKKKTEI